MSEGQGGVWLLMSASRPGGSLTDVVIAGLKVRATTNRATTSGAAGKDDERCGPARLKPRPTMRRNCAGRVDVTSTGIVRRSPPAFVLPTSGAP